MKFTTATNSATRTSLPVTIMSVTFDKPSRSILVLGSDDNSRSCRIDRCETIELARSLFSKAKDLIGSKAVFHAAGGNDPRRWFFAIDEVIEDPADIERELIAADHQFEEEDFDPTHSDPNWVVCDEPIQETSRVERLESIAAIWAKGDKLIAERNELALTLRRRLGSSLLRGDVLNADQMAALKVACD